MTTERGRALLDSLGTVNQATRDKLSAGASGTTSADNPLGLRFAKGARVIDLVTGRRGAVLSGNRSGDLGQESFFVRLDHTGLVARGSSELEPDPTPPSSTVKG